MEDNELGESFFHSLFFLHFLYHSISFPPPLLYRVPLPSLSQPSQQPMRPFELPLRPSELSLWLSPLPLRLSHLPLSPSQQPLRPSHTDRKKDGQEGKTSGRIDKDGQNGRPAGMTGTFKDFLKKRFSSLFILCLLHPFAFLIFFYMDVSVG